MAGLGEWWGGDEEIEGAVKKGGFTREKSCRNPYHGSVPTNDVITGRILKPSVTSS